MQTTPAIRTHSFQHFRDLQLSAKTFYDMVEEMIAPGRYPEISTRRMKLSEGGVFSPGKEYLCIKHKQYIYYVCAMPFGKSFMISWWINEEQKRSTNVLAKILFADRFFQKKALVTTYQQLDVEMLFMQSIDALIKDAITRIQAGNVFEHCGKVMSHNNN